MSLPYYLKKRGRIWYVRFPDELTFHSTGFTNRKDALLFARGEAEKRNASVGKVDSGRPSPRARKNDRKRAYLLKKRGNYWHVRFSDESTFHSTHFRSRYDAERFAHRESERRKRSRSPDATLDEFTHDFFIWDTCKWVARQRAKNRSYTEPVAQNNRGILLNHILPRFGKSKVSEITAVEIEDWLISLSLAAQTKNHILYAFSTVLKEAKRDRILDRNPVEDIEPMGDDSKPTSALTDTEMAALFPADPDAFDTVWPEFQFGVMFTLMVSSGMRSGEARALEWPSVIFDVPGVLVFQAVTANRKLGPTKGKERRGAIIPGWTAELLRRWQQASGQDTEFVFRSVRGGFHSKETVYRKFVEAVDRAGIRRRARRIVPRCLRTTYNTRTRQMLLANAMSEDVLRFFIGHRSVQMTDRYDNPELAAKLQAMRALSEQVDTFWGFHKEQ